MVVSNLMNFHDGPWSCFQLARPAPTFSRRQQLPTVSLDLNNSGVRMHPIVVHSIVVHTKRYARNYLGRRKRY